MKNEKLYPKPIDTKINDIVYTDEENYQNIKKLSPNVLSDAIYNYNENPLPIKRVKDLLNNKRLNAIHRALYYYILFVKKDNDK